MPLASASPGVERASGLVCGSCIDTDRLTGRCRDERCVDVDSEGAGIDGETTCSHAACAPWRFMRRFVSVQHARSPALLHRR